MNMEKQTIHSKIAKIKYELSHRKINKSGHNKHSGFKYHELNDFMPHILELNNKYGVSVYANFLKKQGICTLKIINTDDVADSYTVVIPFVEAQMLGKAGSVSNVDAIQRMGSTITYNRRYLFMTAYDIVENDTVDAISGETNKPLNTQPAINELNACKTLKELQEVYVSLSTEEKSNALILAKKDELKVKLHGSK